MNRVHSAMVDAMNEELKFGSICFIIHIESALLLPLPSAIPTVTATVAVKDATVPPQESFLLRLRLVRSHWLTRLSFDGSRSDGSLRSS